MFASLLFALAISTPWPSSPEVAPTGVCDSMDACSSYAAAKCFARGYYDYSGALIKDFHSSTGQSCQYTCGSRTWIASCSGGPSQTADAEADQCDAAHWDVVHELLRDAAVAVAKFEVAIGNCGIRAGEVEP